MPHRPVAAGQPPDRDRRRPRVEPTSMAKPANGPRSLSTGRLIWHRTASPESADDSATSQALSSDIEHSSLSINVARLGSSVATVSSLRDRRDGACLVWRCEGAGAGDAGPELELCYLDADGNEHRELPSAWPGLLPETFMPAREFRWARSQRHLPGLWWSVTMGAHVGYESWLERPINRTN